MSVETIERTETTALIDRLDRLPAMDWNSFNEVSRITRELLVDLVADKTTLGILARRIEHDQNLLDLCERHELLERLDIYDARDRNFQIRFNFTTPTQSVRPHDHRYSFSTYVLRGGYQHIWFDPGQEIYEVEREMETRNYLDKSHTDESTAIDITRMKPLFVTNDTAGAQYTIHHSTVHATITQPESLSLIIKGPGEKNRSIIADRVAGKIWWRFGRAMEPEARIRQKKMSRDYYHVLLHKLETWGVIQ
jgi:hypothetical protein